MTMKEMRIHFAVSHPQNDRIQIDELKEIIAKGEFYLVECRNMNFDFYDAIAVDQYDEEKDRENMHYAESAKQITSLFQIDEYLRLPLSAIETYATKDPYDEAYWTVTIVTDENLEEWEGE